MGRLPEALRAAIRAVELNKLDGSASSLSLFGAAEAARLEAFEPDGDELEARAVMFADAMNDSPAFGAYFAGVGAHFDHGASRARRHPGQ